MPHFILDARTATSHFPGIGRYVTNLARSLAPLLTSDEQLIVLYDPTHPLSLSPAKSVQLIPAAASPFSLQQQWAIPRLLRRLAIGRRSSSVLYHSAYILMPYLPGVPTVLTVYDLIPLLMPEQSSSRARLLARWANVLALRTAHRVIAISAAARADYVQYMAAPAEKIVAVPLAADPAFAPIGGRDQGSGIRGQETAVSRKYNLPERYVLYLGSNKPHKNLVRLIEAWHIAVSGFQLPASSLVIAGAWDGRYPEAKQRADELGLRKKVHFLGPVAEDDLPALYGGAALFVFPSLYEGFGLPVLEAMACAVPVICSNVSSLPEVAGDAAIQVNPLDMDALAAAIGRVLGNAALAEEMRQRSLRQAGRFTWAQTAQQTLAIYRQVIG
ncbi:MAG: glycosyltransferase family 1 protein [Chloroflexi bacterium]|nr:glycosyltransferase family 1 protein [Chloroflexota bacterium]